MVYPGDTWELLVMQLIDVSGRKVRARHSALCSRAGLWLPQGQKPAKWFKCSVRRSQYHTRELEINSIVPNEVNKDIPLTIVSERIIVNYPFDLTMKRQVDMHA